MIPAHIALVNFTPKVLASEVAEVAAVLNEQAQADLNPEWNTHISVGLLFGRKVVRHTWRLELHDGIDQPGALGYHTDEHGQPFSVVDVSQGDWIVTASHEMVEMAVDPFGYRMHTVDALAVPGFAEASGSGARRVRPLVEVADPCEQATYAVGGVQVSDFTTRRYWRSSGLGPFSRTGILSAPMQVAPGGYISFLDPTTNDWWQLFVGSESSRQFKNLGAFDRRAFGSIREFTDAKARELGNGVRATA